MPQRVQYGIDRPHAPTPLTTRCLGAPPPVASSVVLVSQSQRANEARDMKLRSQELTKLEDRMHSRSTASISTTASRSSSSAHGSSSGHASSCESPRDSLASDSSKPRQPSHQLDSAKDSLALASNPAAMELQRTLLAQDQVRRWVSTAMDAKITRLEKELESRTELDRKNKQEKDLLDRQRSQAQITHLQNTEKRHKRQHDVYEEALRIEEERREQALEKVQKWDKQVHAVMCDREDNHQIRKDIQRMASCAMESLNDKIHKQQVQGKINTEELRDHMTRCLSHELFDPIPVEHIEERMVSPPRTLRSSRSEQALRRHRFEHATSNPRIGKGCANSPQYRYRPIERMVSLNINIDRYQPLF